MNLPNSLGGTSGFWQEKELETKDYSGYFLTVKTAKRLRRKNEAEVMDQATDNLLSALKRDMLAKEGRVDYEKLRKQGYSDRLLYRLGKT